MHASRRVPIASLVLILLLSAGCSRILERTAHDRVQDLFTKTTPPGSKILGGPYRTGEGNNPRVCHGDFVRYVVGSPLTKEQISQHYAGLLSPGWSTDASTAETIHWRKAAKPFDEAILIEFQPSYIHPESEIGQRLQVARNENASGFLLTIIAVACNDNFP